MGVQENWLANLKAIVDAEAPGKSKRPGYRAVSTLAGLSEEYVYQLYTARKRMGIDKAKAIARAFANGRDQSWFDLPPTKNAPKPAKAPPAAPGPRFEDSHWVDDSDWVLLQAAKMLPPTEKEQLLRRGGEIRELYEQWEREAKSRD